MFLWGKMLVPLVFSLAFLMAVGVAQEERADVAGQWMYVLENGGATIAGPVEGPSGDLRRPDGLDGYPMGIRQGAFADGMDITGVTIPKSVTSIAAEAFGRCMTPMLLRSCRIRESVPPRAAAPPHGPRQGIAWDHRHPVVRKAPL